RERAHDYHEHEEVVDREALLDDVAGEVLRPELPSGDDRERDTEQHGDSDIEDRPSRRLANADRVWVSPRAPQVERDKPSDQAERRGPAGNRRMDHYDGRSAMCICAVCSVSLW